MSAKHDLASKLSIGAAFDTDTLAAAALSRIAFLEAALMQIADGFVPAYVAALDKFEADEDGSLDPAIRALQDFARAAVVNR